MARPRTLLLILALFLSLSLVTGGVPAAAGQQGAILRGTVVDQSGGPIAGVRVSVQRWDQGLTGRSATSTATGTARLESDTTGDDGTFSVLNLYPRVDYRVRFEKDGYIPQEVRRTLRVAVNEIGTFMLTSGDVQRAREAYERGYDAYNTGNLPGAIEPMQQVLEVYGDSDSSDEMLIVALGVLGQAYLQQNRVEDARTSFERLLSVVPDNAIGLRGIGQVNAMGGEMGPAIEQFERAVEMEPDNANGRFLLGYALQLSGRPEQAVPHLEACLELQPRFARAHQSLGMAWADLGDNAAAVGHLEAYLAAAPGAPDAAQVQAKIAELKR